MTQSIKAVRAGLFVACRDTIFVGKVDSVGAPVLVTYGAPGSYQSQNIVAVGMTTRQPITQPTAGTGRSRDTHAELDTVISVYRAGADQQQAAAEDCDDLALLLEAYFRTSPNERFSGACYASWVSNIDGPRIEASVNPESGAIAGYIAESVATVTASIRY